MARITALICCFVGVLFGISGLRNVIRQAVLYGADFLRDYFLGGMLSVVSDV
jgi:hypothetical protein